MTSLLFVFFRLEAGKDLDSVRRDEEEKYSSPGKSNPDRVTLIQFLY
jgi:hypothetical protein